MTPPAHDRSSASPQAHDRDDVPTQFDSSFGEDAKNALRDEHWTAAAAAADSSIDSALARFEQASMAFAVVARAAGVSAPAQPTVASPEAAASPEVPEAAAIVRADATPSIAPPPASAAEVAPPQQFADDDTVLSPLDALMPAPRAEPPRGLPLKPTPSAGRAMAPPEMVTRAFEDTRPNFPLEAAAARAVARSVPDAVSSPRPAATGGGRLPWLAIAIAIGVIVVIAGGVGLLARKAPKPVAPTTSQAAPNPPVTTTATTTAPATRRADTVADTEVAVATPAPAAQVDASNAAPAVTTAATDAPVAAPATAPAAAPAAKNRASVDVGAAIANAQSKSDRFLSGGGATGGVGQDVKADATR